MKARRIGIGAVVLLLAIQLVPYGREHTRLPVVNEPAWDAPGTRELFMRACGDCHSHETRWPRYASIAPLSWVIQHHVEHGREYLNVSTWGQGRQEGDQAARMVREGEMPLPIYLPLHAEARLGDGDRTRLIEGLERTFGSAEDP